MVKLAGVPTFSPIQDNRFYFNYHHTAADTLEDRAERTRGKFSRGRDSGLRAGEFRTTVAAVGSARCADRGRRSAASLPGKIDIVILALFG